jgi:transporter family-2 protein
MMVLAGALITFQSPINAALARKTGVFEAATTSFTVGALLLLAILPLVGKGSLRAVTTAPYWQLLGGILGALYVTAIILVIPKIGVAAAMVGVLAGQLTAGILIDRLGWFGLHSRPIDPSRVAAIVLIFVALWLMVPKR